MVLQHDQKKGAGRKRMAVWRQRRAVFGRQRRHQHLSACRSFLRPAMRVSRGPAMVLQHEEKKGAGHNRGGSSDGSGRSGNRGGRQRQLHRPATTPQELAWVLILRAFSCSSICCRSACLAEDRADSGINICQGAHRPVSTERRYASASATAPATACCTQRTWTDANRASRCSLRRRISWKASRVPMHSS